ncbi:phosphohistidine phosphatase SixA [Thalassotalea ganghwensis]
MQIFIMRHGQASPSGETDSQRPLTPYGIEETEKMARWLSRLDSKIDTVWVSPYLRAQQTAQYVKRQLTDVETTDTLPIITPSGNAKQVHDFIDGALANHSMNTLLIVSHMPLVSYLVAELTAEGNAAIFQTASIAQIDYDVDNMRGNLISMVSPNEL